MAKVLKPGVVYNRLTLLNFVEFRGRKKNNPYWLVRCICGVEKIACGYQVVYGQVKSCGCLSREVKQSGRKHGLSRTRFYRIYQGIQLRCTKPSHGHYYLYGGRGIKCHWNSFEEYRDDMLESYKEHVLLRGESDTTIDRINVNDHYYKENCRWTTRKEQARNKRSTFRYEYNGKEVSMVELSEKTGIQYNLIVTRRANGWSLGEILNGKKRSTIKRKNMKKLENISMQLTAYLSVLNDKEKGIITQRFGLVDGTPKTLQEVATEFGITRERVRQIEKKALSRIEALDKSLTQE